MFSCSNGTCEGKGSINNFEEVCSKECIHSDQAFYKYTDCTKCTISTVYGTGCSPFQGSKYTCTSLFPLIPYIPVGTNVYNCTQKVCGSLFHGTYDCTKLYGSCTNSTVYGTGCSPYLTTDYFNCTSIDTTYPGGTNDVWNCTQSVCGSSLNVTVDCSTGATPTTSTTTTTTTTVPGTR